MTTHEIEKEITFAKEHPFQVIYFELPKYERNGFYLLNGDKCKSPESWKGKELIFTNVYWLNKKEKEYVRKSRLEDMKETYCVATETDGSKVNWKPIIYKQND